MISKEIFSSLSNFTIELVRSFPEIWRRIQKKDDNTLKTVKKAALDATGERDGNAADHVLKTEPAKYRAFSNKLLRQELLLRREAYKASGQNSNRSLWMAGLASCGMIASFVFAIYCKDCCGTEITALAHVAMGLFGACIKDVFAFEFGSSKFSEKP